MKLSKEEIQFIDTYLVNKDIIYVDIRYEMIDHIASAVEEKMEAENINFYEAFKDYMVLNRNEFFKTNKKYIRIAWRNAVKILVKNTINPVFIGVILLIYFLFYGIKNLFSRFNHEDDFYSLQLILMLIFGGMYLYKHFSDADRFSVADKMIWLYWVLFYLSSWIFKLQDQIHSLNLLLVYYSIMFGIAVIAFYTYFELIKSYKNKFKLS